MTTLPVQRPLLSKAHSAQALSRRERELARRVEGLLDTVARLEARLAEVEDLQRLTLRRRDLQIDY